MRLPQGGPSNALGSDDTWRLLGEARAGDRGAYSDLYSLLYPRFSAWARRRIPPSARQLNDTGDIVQEALVAALDKLPHLELRNKSMFLSYVRTAIMNRIFDQIRRARLQVRLTSLPILEQGLDPQEEFEKKEFVERYELALLKLSATDQSAIQARIELAMTWQEVANCSGLSTPDAARMRVKRALLKLAEDMGPAS